MKNKAKRLETLKMIISSRTVGGQRELLELLAKEGFHLTQATLSRDMKQLKIAKAASSDGSYMYVLPNETMYRRVSSQYTIQDMLHTPGFISIEFTSNLAVIRTRPGYASQIAYDIDNAHVEGVLGTIAGDDTIFIAFKEGFSPKEITESIGKVVPMQKHRGRQRKNPVEE